jgi:UDP:flavonoid glycosyltransferase YjiC (YdhE family)
MAAVRFIAGRIMRRNELSTPRVESTLREASDQDTVVRAMEDAMRILGEYTAPGPHDATRTVHRLIAVLGRDEVVLALDRMKRRRTLRLVE